MGEYTEIAIFAMSTSVISGYAMFSAIILKNVNEITVYSMIAVEILLNIWHCYQIIKLDNKIKQDLESRSEDDGKTTIRRKATEMLVLVELIDVLVPALYAVAFATAYYGPNSTIIGNVRNGYWGYEETMDAENDIMRLVLMFSVEFCCVIVIGILLWMFSKINFFQAYCNVMKKYWFILAIKIPQKLAIFFLNNDINLGMDFTLEFDWITEDGRLRLIQNETIALDYEMSGRSLNTTKF